MRGRQGHLSLPQIAGTRQRAILCRRPELGTLVRYHMFISSLTMHRFEKYRLRVVWYEFAIMLRYRALWLRGSLDRCSRLSIIALSNLITEDRQIALVWITLANAFWLLVHL